LPRVPDGGVAERRGRRPSRQGPCPGQCGAPADRTCRMQEGSIGCPTGPRVAAARWRARVTRRVRCPVR